MLCSMDGFVIFCCTHPVLKKPRKKPRVGVDTSELSLWNMTQPEPQSHRKVPGLFIVEATMHVCASKFTQTDVRETHHITFLRKR